MLEKEEGMLAKIIEKKNKAKQGQLSHKLSELLL